MSAQEQEPQSQNNQDKSSAQKDDTVEDADFEVVDEKEEVKK